MEVALSADPAPAPVTRRRRLPGGLHALLFGVYPVLFLWSQNLGETSFDVVIVPLVVVLLAVAVGLGIAGLAFRDLARGALVVTPLVFGVLMYGHVAEVVDDVGIPVRLQQLGWAGLVGLGALGAWRLDAARVRRLDSALTSVGALLVAVTLVTIVPYETGSIVESAGGRGSPSLGPGSGPLMTDPREYATTTEAPKRDVYWLVFDRYGSDRSIELAFGKPSALTPWLRENGFTVLEDSHANYVKTALSMSTTLNVTHLERLAAEMGPTSGDHDPVYDSLHDPVVARQFKALGYSYHHIGSWWNPTRTDRGADVNYNADGLSDFAAVLYDTSALPVVSRLLGLVERQPSARTRHYEHNVYGLDTLDSLRAVPGPKFVLAHILLPHTPYVFDRDGTYVQAADARGRSVSEAWDRQLEYTNRRLQAFFEDLLALPPEQQPIIIFQADEGPWDAFYQAERQDLDWATAPEDEVEIKFGIMNAWYVPGGTEALGLDPAQTAINTFPVLFSRYFGLSGYELLPDRIYGSGGWRRPYDLTDITDRVPSLR